MICVISSVRVLRYSDSGSFLDPVLNRHAVPGCVIACLSHDRGIAIIHIIPSVRKKSMPLAVSVCVPVVRDTPVGMLFAVFNDKKRVPGL